MAKFVKRQVMVEAIQWNGGDECKNELQNFIKTKFEFVGIPAHGLKIKTLEDIEDSWHYASLGDWIIEGVEGEFYACKPEIFEKTYEALQIRETKQRKT